MAVFLLAQVYGVRQWGLCLVISRPATSHAQSIIAHSIMYQSLQNPSISADPGDQTPTFTHTSGRSSLSNKSITNEDVQCLFKTKGNEIMREIVGAQK